MPISLTNIGTNNGVSPISVTVPAGGVPVGALICVCIGTQDTVTFSTATISNTGNAQTWNEVGSGPTGNSSFVSNDIWYAFNCASLVSGNTITNTSSSSNQITISCFYATGIQTSPNPQDTSTRATSTGSSTTPSAQLAATPAVANSLVLGTVAVHRAPTFTQDSTNAAYATPPVLASTGGTTATDVEVAGGTVVSSSQLTYAPTLGTVRPWVEIVVAFKPSITANVTGWEAQGAQFVFRPSPHAVGGSPT